MFVPDNMALISAFISKFGLYFMFVFSLIVAYTMHSITLSP